MTARRSRRRNHQARIVTAIALTAVAVAAATTVAHVIGWVAATAAVGAVCWYAGRRTRPVTRAKATTRPRPRGADPDPPPEWYRRRNAHLENELEHTRMKARQLAADLADAKASATAAWDAAADRPPARRAATGTAPGVVDVDQLANQPMSGARRIGRQ
jgi:hypothetical protein